jgi:hypothetical protein
MSVWRTISFPFTRPYCVPALVVQPWQAGTAAARAAGLKCKGEPATGLAAKGLRRKPATGLKAKDASKQKTGGPSDQRDEK